jgi:hypothetical protein
MSGSMRYNKRRRRSWQPLAFFSRKLLLTEMLYSTFDRELFAAFSAIKHFCFFMVKVVLSHFSQTTSH